MINGKVVVLGAGMQGKATLYDLAKRAPGVEIVGADREVASAKRNLEELGATNVRLMEVDAANPNAIRQLLAGADVLIDLLPSTFTLPIAEIAVESGVNVVNAMYLANPAESDPEKRAANAQRVARLSELAQERGVAVLAEMGMDPGIDLVLSGHAVRTLDETHELWSYGAGFPDVDAATNPIKYKLAWTFEGVLKSYVRPGHYLRDSEVVEVGPAEVFSPSNTHTLDVPGLGTLEAFPNGDSLHYAELLGIRGTVKSMGRYILRWPGHGAFWGPLAQLGFLSEEPITVNGQSVIPRDFVIALLEPQIRYAPHERDVALIQVEARGVRAGERVRNVFTVLDKRDLETGFTSMARTTGFTASIGAQLLLNGIIGDTGVLSPANHVPYEPFVAELAKRGIVVSHEQLPWQDK